MICGLWEQEKKPKPEYKWELCMQQRAAHTPLMMPAFWTPTLIISRLSNPGIYSMSETSVHIQDFSKQDDLVKSF